MVISLVIFIILDKKDEEVKVDQFFTFFVIYLVSTFILYLVFNSMEKPNNLADNISTGLKMI